MEQTTSLRADPSAGKLPARANTRNNPWRWLRAGPASSRRPTLSGIDGGRLAPQAPRLSPLLMSVLHLEPPC